MIFDFVNNFGRFKNASELANHYKIDGSGWIKHMKQYKRLDMTSFKKCLILFKLPKSTMITPSCQ